MYAFERFILYLKSCVRNRNRPEGCIAESYIAKKAVEFCTEYLFEVDPIGISSSRNLTTDDTKASKIIEGRPLAGGKVVQIGSLSWEQAHLYVLHNTQDVLPYIK
ncbi:hypothetical protein AQUCO_10300004v1 [Aquilegia coerulea]|uniref:DUF4218 domain-containing protein n=1 Tax=Aquilegia coerulea TaxID=218851 RepID=A0A2G5C3U4_AQUCA|nr:hypothetical protein AQUCO_10300004v1 [Aquilegia coerulea]